MRCVFFLLLLIGLALGQDVQFNDQSDYQTTSLLSGDLPFTQQDPATEADQRVALGSKKYWFIQVQGPISDSLKDQLNEYLSAKNTSLGQYFAYNTFLVQVTNDGSNIRQWLKLIPGVINVVSFKSNFKIAPKLKALVNNATNENFTDITLHVQLFSGLAKKLSKSNKLVNSEIADLKNFISTLTPTQQAAVTVKRVSSSSFNVGISDYSALQQIVIWLSNEVEVQWVEKKSKNKPLNQWSNRVIQSDSTSLPLYDHGLHGENIVIGVGDTGIDYDHCYFNDQSKPVTNKVLDLTRRKIAYYSALPGHALGDVKDGHGTHVAGTVGGICDPEIDAPTNISLFHGIATGAKIAMIQFGSRTDKSIFDTPDYLPDYFEEQRLDGAADLSTNSWGSDEWDFPSEAFYLDRYAHTHPNFLILFAAGNAGDSRGWGSIIAPAMAKNALTVGASDSMPMAIWGAPEDRMEPFTPGENEWRPAYFSSRGPTVDGRIKPDILAPGRVVKSSRSDGDLTTNQCKNSDLLLDEGTSMATPAVAGLSAITLQYFSEGWYPSGAKTAEDAFIPPSSLLKAVMVASGQSIVGSKELTATVLDVPDMIQGFGRVQLNTVLYFNSAPNFNRDLFVLPDKVTTPTISTGDRHIYCFKVSVVYETTSPGSKTHTFPLKATLVWTDHYGAMGAAVKAVNNLDLAIVQAGTGSMWLGNNLPNKHWDVLNNVEQASILNPNVTSGNGYFGVVVYGANVPEGPQAYSLVVTGNVEKQADNSKCGTSAFVCPQNCGVGAGLGTCNQATGHCTCIATRAGAGCQSVVKVLTPTTVTPLKYAIPSQALGLHASIYYKFTLAQAKVTSLPVGLQIRVRTTQKWKVPVGLQIFFAMNEVPTNYKFTRSFYTNAGDDNFGKVASAWNFNIPKALIKTGANFGGTVSLTIYNTCCGPLQFSVNIVQI